MPRPHVPTSARLHPKAPHEELPDGLNPGTHSLAPRGHRYSWITLVITTLALLMTSIDGNILPAVLPEISQDFNLNAQQGGWINSAFFGGTVAGAFFFGWLSDKLGSGYRRSLTWNIAMVVGIVGGALTFGFAGSFLAFLLLRIPMGISRGGSEPVNVAITSEWWPKEHRGFALGVHQTGFPIGQFVTGALIAAVLGVAGWREAFLLIPLLGIPIVIAQAIVGRRRNQQKVWDWIDREGLTRPTKELSNKSTTKVVASVKEAMRSKNARWAVLLMFLFLWGEAGAVTFLTTQFTQLGMSNSQAAVISGASGLTGWIGQVVWGTWSDRAGRKFALGFLIFGWATTLIAMIFITGPTSAWIVLLAWGLFRNAPFPVGYALIVDSVPRLAGTSMGIMVGIAVGASGLIAAPVAGALIDHFGFTTHYVVLAGICLLGLYPLSKMTETVNREHPTEHVAGPEAGK